MELPTLQFALAGAESQEEVATALERSDHVATARESSSTNSLATAIETSEAVQTALEKSAQVTTAREGMDFQWTAALLLQFSRYRITGRSCHGSRAIGPGCHRPRKRIR